MKWKPIPSFLIVEVNCIIFADGDAIIEDGMWSGREFY